MYLQFGWRTHSFFWDSKSFVEAQNMFLPCFRVPFLQLAVLFRCWLLCWSTCVFSLSELREYVLDRFHDCNFRSIVGEKKKEGCSSGVQLALLRKHELEACSSASLHSIFTPDIICSCIGGSEVRFSAWYIEFMASFTHHFTEASNLPTTSCQNTTVAMPK